MFNNQSNPFLYYKNQSTLQEANIKIINNQLNRTTYTRIALAITEIVLFITLLNTNSSLWIAVWSVLMIVPIIIFIQVVKKQGQIEEKLKFEKDLLSIYQNEIQLFEGGENIYDNGNKFENDKHSYTSDLDVFGEKSLFELTNRCNSNLGNQRLAHHFSVALSKEEINERQIAVGEVIDRIEETFVFRAIMLNHIEDKVESIKQKLTQSLPKQLSFVNGKFLQFYVKYQAYLLGLIFLTALVFGGKVWSIFGLLVFINVFLSSIYGKNINQVYHGFSGSSKSINNYANAIAWIENINWKSSYLTNIVQSNDYGSKAMKSLAKIINSFDARLNMLLYAFLNYFLLWDLKCCIQLSNWCSKTSNAVSISLESLGYFEEIISIATLSYNHPQWAFPEIATDFVLEATQIGHPFIAKSNRVDSDFCMNKIPSVDIITGSNMSGKSTFLRTVGVNMVLAYAGAPVCAKSLRLSVFNILTYMRIKDNLTESTSTFKAELNRLKMILKEVELKKNSFVLIDEMLRGTNSKDKFEGSKAFIEQINVLNIPMLFATHDLQLSELEDEHPKTIRNFHFDIQMNNEDMNFDYKIKQGPCTQFNAAILLKQLGLRINT